jgi:alkylation response protein AidB-like acyl-CoA dehydrogenase
VIEFDPDEEQALIAETVRQFAENEIRPLARQADEDGSLPEAVLAQAHELGLVTNSLPASEGGGDGRSAVTSCLIAEELAWGDLSIALGILSPSLLALPVSDYGTAEQRAELLPPLLSPEFTPGSLAIVEPRFDFDVFAPQTTAIREGDEYVLSGAKCFVPWQAGETPLLVVAEDAGSSQIFIVPRGATGLKVEAERNMGIQALPTVELTLEGVRIPASARLGGDSGSDVRTLVNRSRIGLAAMAIGVARATFEVARDYALEREAFGVPIATKQAIAFKLADMAIEIDAARLLTWEAAAIADQGDDVTRETTLALSQASKTALDAADGSVQILGGHGYIRDYLPELHLRNARGFASFEGLTLL